MSTRVKIMTVLGTILVALATGTMLIVHSQKQDNTANQTINNQQDDRGAKIRKKIEENGDPIADYDSLNSAENEERRKIRAKRNKKYNVPNLKPEDAKRFVLNDNSSTIAITNWTTRKREPAFPVSDSDCVVVGTVTDAKAFLSEDKITAYSEFDLATSEILKQNNNKLLKEGEQINITRWGGKVRLRSGKILFQGIDGMHMPKIGKRYVMFLKYDTETELYRIITGYELQEGKVIPLDGLNILGEPVEQYENYQKYKDSEEIRFLNLVRVATSQNGNQTGGILE